MYGKGFCRKSHHELGSAPPGNFQGRIAPRKRGTDKGKSERLALRPLWAGARVRQRRRGANKQTCERNELRKPILKGSYPAWGFYPRH
jgi:hypothetical protein